MKIAGRGKMRGKLRGERKDTKTGLMSGPYKESMRRQAQKPIWGLLVFMILLIGMIGCTKKTPYTEVEGKQGSDKGVFPKSSIDTFYGLNTEEVNSVKNAQGLLEQNCGRLAGENIEVVKKMTTNQLLKAYLKVVRANSNSKPKSEGANTCKQTFEKIAIAKDKQKRLNSYIATTSYGQLTRTTAASPSHFMGDAKVVKFDMSENRLDIRAVEKDERFVDNPTNSRLILSIPVRHVDYKCQVDAFGECQNKEEEDNSKPWAQRRFIEVDAEKIKAHGAESLPIELDNLFDGCYSETGARLIDKEIKDGVINIEVERSFLITNLTCAGAIESLDDLSFDVRYKYSIVRANLIATGDYEPVFYEKEDEQTFGFFTTESQVLDVDNSSNEDSDLVLMNRWNPKRKVIQYHLSESFANPDNDYVLEATLEGIKRINRGLTEANTGLQIEAVMPSGKQAGDLRHNMIVLVDDPLSSRIIGYGPSVAHPLTGEIVNARTVMYLGTIKTIVKRTYDEIRDEVLSEKEKLETEALAKKAPALVRAASKVKGVLSSLFKQKGATVGLGQEQTPIEMDGLQKILNAVNVSSAPKTVEKKSLKSLGLNKDERLGKDDPIIGALTPNLKAIKKELSRFRKIETNSILQKEKRYTDARIDKLSRMNVYPEELFNAHFAMESAGIASEISEGDMPEWSELSNDEQESIIRVVLPHIWIPTFVHEMGHNLGLRHNFAGSEDQANFYTRSELSQMGIDREIPYASVMEYSYRTMNELPTLGKYDIAALRFAYNRVVDVQVLVQDDAGNDVVEVQNRTVKRSLRETEKELALEGAVLLPYEYCTDEYVDANPNCNRFDEGVGYTAITEHYIRAYEANYDRLNRRNNRRSFSLYGEPGYLGRVIGSFYDLRLMYEVHDRIRNEFGVADNSDLWEEIPFLKDLKNASTLAGRFLLSVAMTPDVNCAVALAEAPSTPIDVVPIRFLGREDATTCFHPVVEENLKEIGGQMGLDLVVAGEAGKSFRSRKDSLNRNSYADQIDVQGIWIDKLLAADLLFKRELGSRLFDNYTSNFLAHPVVGKEITGVMASILLERGQVEVPFRNAQGRSAQFLFEGETPEDTVVTDVLPVNLSYRDDHLIDVPEVGGLSRYFGLPGELSHFRKELLNVAVTNASGIINGSKGFVSTFQVFRDIPNGIPAKDFESVDVGAERYLALKGQNQVAIIAIQSLKISRELQVLLEGVPEQTVEVVLELVKNKQPLPSSLPAETKKKLQPIHDYASKNNNSGVKVIEDYLSGAIKESTFYEELLSYLPRA